MSDDFSELAADLRDVAWEAGPNLEKAIEFTAAQIKQDWRDAAKVSDRWGRKNFARAYASSIDYTMEFSFGEIAAEIGPNPGRAGGSAGFLEEAPGGVVAAPQHAGRNALEANQQDFTFGIARAIVDTLGDHNL